MQYLQKRVWNPVLSFEAQLHCKQIGDPFLKDLRHYGCFCGVTAKMRKYTDPSTVEPKDALDRCCKEHNQCLKNAIDRRSDTYCSSNNIKECETQLIDCISKKVKFNDLKAKYKNFDRAECH
ncbi:hypothetical protein AWC38_SpisGene9962 [Stylophora pistillata]|uniref:Phospholipase A2-like central domain-containing protein n=2 Tax=Stylophora pistillata TaxID=50429 RepID=A0A2B4SA17_STYPI|nr:hypothetical protein AWC38_SpisGene9962 [Stylophora pistillata]